MVKTIATLLLLTSAACGLTVPGPGQGLTCSDPVLREIDPQENEHDACPQAIRDWGHSLADGRCEYTDVCGKDRWISQCYISPTEYCHKDPLPSSAPTAGEESYVRGRGLEGQIPSGVGYSEPTN